jgi:tetratricopeptide (TPR) repeat protein
LLRVQRLLAVYGEAKAALQAQDFGRAIQTFDRLDKEQPGYLDVQARLAEARSGFAESQRVAAQSAMANAVAAEKRGDLVEAQRLYERALEGDPVSGADEALRRVRVQMKTHGDAAFRRARTFDAMSRTEDAIAQYERAVQLLPPDDPNRKTAKDRLDVLRMNYIK